MPRGATRARFGFFPVGGCHQPERIPGVEVRREKSGEERYRAPALASAAFHGLVRLFAPSMFSVCQRAPPDG